MTVLMIETAVYDQADCDTLQHLAVGANVVFDNEKLNFCSYARPGILLTNNTQSSELRRSGVADE
jgi:hypothetical protein